MTSADRHLRRVGPAGLDRSADVGIATVWGVAIMGILLLFAAVSAGVVSLIGARHQAETAADFAALAGAQAAVDGEDACEAAREIAAANDGSMTSCKVADEVVEVRVDVDGPPLLGTTWTLTGRARAGPA
ncbi:MAG TPA: Rv3654c family TadE-like protein [Nocardioidaceae bacterium]|nr:Rv3654c family TadE-like protein [Nocardioidaceae bacterium]